MDTPTNIPTPPLPSESVPAAQNTGGGQRRFKIVLITIVGLLALAGVAFGGYYYYQQQALPPEETVKRALLNMAEATSFAFEGGVQQELSFQDVSDTELALYLPHMRADIDIDGALNVKEEKNPRLTFHGKGKAEYDMGGFNISFSGDVAYIYTDSKAYLKLDLPRLLAMMGFGDIKDDWIVIDEELLDEFDMSEVGEDEKSLMVTAMQKLKRRFAEASLLSSVEPMETERIDGMSTQRYRVTLNKKAMEELFLGMLEESYPYSDMLLEEDKEMFKKALDGFTIETLDIWVDKKELLPRKVVAHMKGAWRLQDFETESDRRYRERYGGEAMSGTAVYTMNMDVRYKDINKDIKIDAPGGAKTLEQIMEEAENGANPGPLISARLKGQDATIKAHLSGIRTQAEIYYDNQWDKLGYGVYGTRTVPVGPCPKGAPASGTIFADAQIASALDRVEEVAKIRPACSLTASGRSSAWAVSAPLRAERGFYWCVDSTGMSGKTRGPIRASKCPAVVPYR